MVAVLARLAARAELLYVLAQPAAWPESAVPSFPAAPLWLTAPSLPAAPVWLTAWTLPALPAGPAAQIRRARWRWRAGRIRRAELTGPRLAVAGERAQPDPRIRASIGALQHGKALRIQAGRARPGQMPVPGGSGRKRAAG